MARPIIGITSSFRKDAPPVGIFSTGGDYVKSVMLAGGAPAPLPITAEASIIDAYVGMIDGLILPGGGDVSPDLYGEEPSLKMSGFSHAMDAFETALVKGCVAAGKPVLGICRGMQIINVAYGGSMTQDIPSMVPGAIAHFGSMSGRDELFHSVTLSPGSRIHQIFGADKIRANSFHHQAVKRLGEGFTATAFAPDGVVEAIEADALGIFCVEFHPENLTVRYPEFLGIFTDLIARCKK